MVYNRTKHDIVNLDSFTRDSSKLFDRKSLTRNFIVNTPTQNNITISSNDLQNLINQILKLSSNLPHRKCALGYKINENSITSLEIYPVTDAA